MIRRIGLLGYPLAHSISPAFHQAALDHHALPLRYEAWPTPPAELSRAVAMLRGGEFLGANVTIPHKERVMPLLDRADPSADSLGAANVIVKEGEELVGHNTDAYGFLQSLRKVGGFEPEGKSVLMLGAGGAARAAAFGLAGVRAGRLTITNRTPERALSLAGELSATGIEAEAVPFDHASLAAVLPIVDLIVNATSIGMSHGASEGGTPLKPSLIPPTAFVFDMVYNPRETPLLIAARAAGARALGGLAMLIYQGAASFRLWTGMEPPVGVMFRAGEDALAATEERGL